MLRFSDFSHLPEVDGLVRELIDNPSGLIVVAGLDSRPAGIDPALEGVLPFLPSGRSTIFRVLAGEILDAHSKARGLILTEDRSALNLARRFKQRLELIHVKPPLTYAEAIETAGRRVDLLIVDRITRDNLPLLLSLARGGLPVLSQLDTVFQARAVARYLADFIEPPHDLQGLQWVISVQRLPTLCPICKHPAEVTPDQLAQLEMLGRRFPSLSTIHAPTDGGAFYAPGTCPACNFTGRQGDVAAFDFARFEGSPAEMAAQASTLPMEAYIWMLAQRGQLALADAIQFESDQLRRTYHLLIGSDRQLAEVSAALERKNAELASAHRLLDQRTRELVSLEGIGQALITWNDLRELGNRVLKAAMELSKADRGILYYVRSAEWGQILASRGWTEAQDELGLARTVIYEHLSDRQPMPFAGPPPGVAVLPDSPPLRSGQALPLVAHGIPAGLMLIQSTRKTQFTPGELALLQTMAGYAAVAMQRAGLIEQLQAKIEALEAAQIELAHKERLDRELELARQVQQSMIPRRFPVVPGLTFAASYAPARQVGGDFYDAFSLDGDRVALVIADVSDKGMPAALYMALSRSLILAQARQSTSPAAVLRSVNKLLIELAQQDMFVTVFYAVLDRATGQLTYARAGHDHPLLIRDGRVEPLGGQGMVLGLFEDDIFILSEETVHMRPGDRLLLFTDGLTDVVGVDDNMYGIDRLMALVRKCATQKPEALCRSLFGELAAYQQSNPQFDDMALLVAAME